MIRTLAVATLLSFSCPALSLASDNDDAQTEDDLQSNSATTLEFLYDEAPGDRAYGDPDANHTLIMYASNVCPHCGNWFNNEWASVKSQLVDTGQLRFVFRPLPSNPMQLSLTGFIMAECAPDESYMTVMEEQFARQAVILDKAVKQTGGLREEYDAIAKVAGMDTPEAITTCLQDETKIAPITLSADRARAAEVSSIPTFIFDGQIMKGEHDFEAIQGWLLGRSSQRG